MKSWQKSESWIKIHVKLRCVCTTWVQTTTEKPKGICIHSLGTTQHSTWLQAVLGCNDWKAQGHLQLHASIPWAPYSTVHVTASSTLGLRLHSLPVVWLAVTWHSKLNWLRQSCYTSDEYKLPNKSEPVPIFRFLNYLSSQYFLILTTRIFTSDLVRLTWKNNCFYCFYFLHW